ncbi:MAG: hydrolase 2, exosortase A system-associated [Casimicrobiaceae bacterium]
MALRQEAFYLPVANGERLCVWRAPANGPLCGRVVHVPAFAEEMNKCRPMTALAARRLAASGFGVLQIDLLGCGDSSGDFGDASWDAWIADVVAAIEWTRAQADVPLWLWGLRGGALLASSVMQATDCNASLLLWQPVLSGRVHLTQFLRLKLASQMLADGPAQGGTRELRAQLQQGANIEIAGYSLSPALAAGMDAAECTFANNVGAVVWLEVGSTAGATLSPGSQALADALRKRGLRVTTQMVTGPGFWQTVETEMCPALVETTVATMAKEGEREESRDSLFL